MTARPHEQDQRFSELYEAHFGEVLRHARRLGPPRHQEDAVQTAFEDLYRKLGRDGVDSVEHPRAWLKQVVFRKLQFLYRQEKKQEDAHARFGDAIGPEPAPISRAAQRLDVREALMSMDAASVNLLTGQLDGLSVRELAAQEGCSEAAARTRLHQAKKQLRARLTGSTRHDGSGARRADATAR